MSPEEISRVASQDGINRHLGFQDDNPLRFQVGDPGPTTRELSRFINDRYFNPPPISEFRRNIYDERRKDQVESGESDGDDSDDEVDEGDEVEEVDQLDGIGNCNKMSSGSVNANIDSPQINVNSNCCDNNDNCASDVGGLTADKLGKSHNFPLFGSGGDRETIIVRESSMRQALVSIETNNTVTIADPDCDIYYSQYIQTPEVSASIPKGVTEENGCAYSGRNDASFSTDPGDSLRTILSDPLSGALMVDAMILPCGHSFGASGIQHVKRSRACYTCSQPVSEESISPNLSLRVAVQAFCREEDLQYNRSFKRRRERYDQDKGNFSNSPAMDPLRFRGGQFPFAVTDKVIIKGNKRTPERFVGRQAVVTTQCLNGWYVVKTLDNAESVKLQYRSLAKVPNESSSKAIPSKMTPNWI